MAEQNETTQAAAQASEQVNEQEQIVAQVKNASVDFRDGSWTFSVPAEHMERGERETTRQGQKVKSGVSFRKFSKNLKVSELENGEGALVQNEKGEIEQTKKVSVLLETVNPEVIQKQNLTKRLRSFNSYLKAATGLTKGKPYLTLKQKGQLLTLNDLHQFTKGERSLRGFTYLGLPTENQVIVGEIMGQLGDKVQAQKARELKTGVGLIENLIAEFRSKGVELDPETLKAVAEYRKMHEPEPVDRPSVEPNAPAMAPQLELQTA